jgi:NADPH:quinone reductase-like Zn-dependent oxidoreductase
VIDYTQEDFTQSGQHYDLILDIVGNHSLLDDRRALSPTGIFVIVGGPSDDPWIGPLFGLFKALVLSPFVSQKFSMMLAQLSQQDLITLSELAQTGKVTPVIDRRYALSEVPAAIRYLELGHARGKIVIGVE